jgi:hypothetical protein
MIPALAGVARSLSNAMGNKLKNLKEYLVLYKKYFSFKNEWEFFSFPPSLPITFKFKDYWRDKKKEAIFIIILIVLVIVLVSINGLINNTPNPDTKLSPSLLFRHIRFEYIDNKDYKTLCDDCEVNLENVARVQFRGYIINDSSSDLLVTINKVVAKTSGGDIVFNQPLDISVKNTPLPPGGEISFAMPGIKADELLAALRENEFFHLIFSPEIEYSISGKPEETFNFNKIMKCANFYKGNQLPLFRVICVSEEI